MCIKFATMNINKNSDEATFHWVKFTSRIFKYGLQKNQIPSMNIRIKVRKSMFDLQCHHIAF